jgi:hypothetical protein
MDSYDGKGINGMLPFPEGVWIAIMAASSEDNIIRGSLSPSFVATSVKII